MSARVLVTGATGFIGSVLCNRLAEYGYIVRAALRDDRIVPSYIGEKAIVGNIEENTEWSEALAGVDMIVHAAARVHVMNDSPMNAASYIEANTLGTGRLASEAARHGVRRFVFLSSIKVNGEESSYGGFTPDEAPRPADAYAVSKWQAEQQLREIEARSGLEVSIVRPPLVYGPGVRANFLRLIEWVVEERLLPFGAIHNRRSLVNVWNLSDLLIRLLQDPEAAGRTWMVSDDDDLSTSELVRRLARALNKRARLVPVPAGLLKLLAVAAGKKAEARRLCGTLVADISRTRSALDWSPAVSVDSAFARTAQWYRLESNSRG